MKYIVACAFLALAFASGSCRAAPTGALEISAKKDAVVIGGKEYPLKDAPAELQKLAADHHAAQHMLYIKAGSGLNYAAIMTVVQTAYKAGFTKITLESDSATGKD